MRRPPLAPPFPRPGRSSCPPLVTNASDRAILDALTEPLGQSELARRSGVPASTLKNAVKRLETAGHVEKVGTLYRRRVVA
jgi:DNA-binding MarR family transcriptional regulator